MVEFVTMLLILATLASSSSSPVFASRDGDLPAAIDEMRSAGYFSFVMLLLAVSPANLSRGNITFLLPDDRTLSNNRLSVHGISKFLLRHTIPSPLLFDYLQHIPTGSVLPTLEPEYMVGINNQGRTSYFLNNIRVSVPNVCVTGSSIRCHGIDGVLPSSFISPSTHCSNGSRVNPVEPKAQGVPSPPSPRDSDSNATLPLSPSNRHTVSGSPPSSGGAEFRYMWALALAVAALWSAGGIVDTQ